jgi:hypothetical protein
MVAVLPPGYLTITTAREGRREGGRKGGREGGREAQ